MSYTLDEYQNTDEDIFKNLGIEVSLKTDFTKVKEVLSRIGIASVKNKNLTQTCHIYHKRGRYAIMHFKEMFLFDGKYAEFDFDDESRRNLIIKTLKQWNMIDIVDDVTEDFPIANPDSIFIVPRYKVIDDGWKLTQKYTFNKR